MIDPFGRRVTYLRLSVTDRCDLRCTYCMAEDMTFLPRATLLSLEELERLSEVFIRHGVRKIRLTGGEPLVRRNVMHLIDRLGARVRAGALDELVLTTNGTLLEKYAADLQAAGVARINVSLDTLDAEIFRGLTRRGDLPRVLAGLEAARRAGLGVKINAVALRGVNDGEMSDLVAWCGARGFDMTLIETMPMGAVSGERADTYLPLSEVRQRLAREWTLTDVAESTGGPSRYARVAETGCRVGFITPLSSHFCEGCNRVRVTCTGRLYLCLGQEDGADLKTPLRSHPEDDGPVEGALFNAIGRKPRGHDFSVEDGAGPTLERHMSVTGG